MRDIGEREAFRGTGDSEDSMWGLKGIILVAIACIIAAYFIAQQSFGMEYTAASRPTLGELVHQDKTYEQQKLEEHYRYNSYETHDEDDRKSLSAIILGEN